MDIYRDAGSRQVQRNSFEPLPKRPRLVSPPKVKKEFEFSASRSNPLPAFAFPSSSNFPYLAQHLTDSTPQSDRDMRNFDCQPSKSGYNQQFEKHFPLNRLNDAYNLYYSNQNDSSNYRNIFAGKKSSY